MFAALNVLIPARLGVKKLPHMSAFRPEASAAHSSQSMHHLHRPLKRFSSDLSLPMTVLRPVHPYGSFIPCPNGSSLLQHLSILDVANYIVCCAGLGGFAFGPVCEELWKLLKGDTDAHPLPDSPNKVSGYPAESPHFPGTQDPPLEDGC